MNFYLNKNGQKLGPYSVEQIQTFVQQRMVLPNDLVWADGWTTWLPISNVPGMQGSSVSSTPLPTTATSPIPQSASTEGMNWLCVWMHLSQFAAFITLFAGYVLPVLIWQTNKHSHPIIDKQGRIITNWIITSLIYDVVVAVLCLFWIGFLIAPFLVFIEFAFPIMGAIKASRGEVWNYPMNISFFKV